MSNVIPIGPNVTFPALSPQQGAERPHTPFWRRRHFWVHSGGILLGATLATTGSAALLAREEKRHQSPSCGVGVAEHGDGAIRIIERAAADAALTGTVRGRDEAVADILAIAPALHPGMRFKLHFSGNTYVDDTATRIADPRVNHCEDLTLLSSTPQAPSYGQGR